MADNYSFGRPSLGRAKPSGLATPGKGQSVPGRSKGDKPAKVARPGGAQSMGSAKAGKGGNARPGGAQHIKG